MKVLLVEDNLAEARFLQEILKGTRLSRFAVTHVNRLQAAVAALQASEASETGFGVVLLDLTLPDSTGLASLDHLIQAAPHLPVVVLTNTNNDELAVAAVRHGAQDYLVKRQINQEILVRSLHYAIERKQTAEALREVNESLEQRVQQRTVELATANELLRQEIIWRQKIQERLELAQQAAQIGTFEWNIQSNQVAWTAELEALYGLEPGSFEDQHDRWLQTIHPDDYASIEQDLQQSLQKGQGLNTEFRILSPDQQVRWIAVKSSLFQDETGQPQRLIGIHIDITEKKLLEAQFLRAQRLESLGTLASGIAHDLNNILTPILAVAQLLPMKLPDLDPQMRHMLDILETSARRGTAMIQQILSFARGAEGKRVSLQINHLLVEIKKMMQQTLPRSIEIVTDFAADLWPVLGDATQLHQVLMNLCVNARDAMPDGGQLTITADKLLLDEAYVRTHLEAKTGAYVRVSITDTGTGIPDSILHRIFDPFFTTKEVGKGTGLGLSAVLGIVKSHGGFVEVQSQPYQGSQFSIYLPACQSVLPPETDNLADLAGDQELILVVDDEPVIGETIRTTLETYNYQVLVAQDGIEAIACFAQQQEQIHCVLIDLMMPGMDGFAVLAVLRQLQPQTPVMAMSGVHSAQIREQVQAQGFQHFLPKPFTAQELLQPVKALQNRPTTVQ